MLLLLLNIFAILGLNVDLLGEPECVLVCLLLFAVLIIVLPHYLVLIC